MKRFAKASEQPVVVPVVVVTVDVHVPLAVVPLVERDELYEVPSEPPPLEYFLKVEFYFAS